MDIRKTLEEAATYFKQQVISGNFEFVSCSDCTAKISIDGYIIELWIANTPKDNFNFYKSGLSDQSILLKHLNFNTQKERLDGWRKIKPFIDEYKNKVLKRETKKKINALKKQLDQLEGK